MKAQVKTSRLDISNDTTSPLQWASQKVIIQQNQLEYSDSPWEERLLCWPPPLNVDAMVLESVYSSIESAVQNRVTVKLGALAALPTKILLMQLKPRMGISVANLRPLDCLPKIGCPVLIMSGADDRHTTAEETHAMFEAANEPKEFWMVEGAGHEDLYDFSPAAYRTRLLSFFKRHLGTG